jgi:hypothetical protein
MVLFAPPFCGSQAVTMKYLDFDLVVEGAGEHFAATVLSSPGGGGSSSFLLPFGRLELENLALRIARQSGRTRRTDTSEL